MKNADEYYNDIEDEPLRAALKAALQEHFARQDDKMKWTSELPTRPGWYFYQRTDGDFPVRVGYVFRARLPVVGMCVSLYYPKAEEEVIGTYLQDLTTPHRWAGPIPEPVDPEE